MPQGCELLVTKETSRLSVLLVQRSWGTFQGGVSQADELEVGLEACVGNVENSMSHLPRVSPHYFLLQWCALFTSMPSEAASDFI